MNPLRRWGRALAPDPEPDRAAAAPAWPPAGSLDGWPEPSAGPATRAARPVAPRSPTDDPPTDPHGWPAVSAPEPGPGSAAAPVEPRPLVSLPYAGATLEARLTEAAAGSLLGNGRPPEPWPIAPGGPTPSARYAEPAAVPAGRPAPRPVAGPPPWPPAEHAEAVGLATAFAADYLSWDESDAPRRGRVLAGYLRVPGADPGRLGWDGTGRQRAEFAIPGRVTAGPAGRLVVEVRVRITPYRSVGATVADPEPEPPGTPAVAPAPTGRGWRSLASLWVAVTVPVVRDGHRLAIDLAPEPTAPDPGPVTRITDDDPPAEPASGPGS